MLHKSWKMKFLKLKKAELSINVIIVAILALLVLVILIYIFSGKLSAFGKETESCTSKGGACTRSLVLPETCFTEGACECPQTDGNYIYIRGTDCEKNKNICCKKVF